MIGSSPEVGSSLNSNSGSRASARARPTRFFIPPLISAGFRFSNRDMPWLIALVRKSKSWAYVDWIAPKVIGDVIARDPRARKRLAAWAKDDDFWVRRAALLAEHDALRAGKGDFAAWSRLAAPMLDEREFFIRQAIGWVLREVSKKRPELAYGFLRKHRDRVSRLSLLEGAKYLPAPNRKALGLPAKAPWAARAARRKAASGRR